MLTKEGTSRSVRDNLVLAFCLAAVAGAVDAVGVLELGQFTSHMSGNAARLALAAGRADLAGVALFAPLIAAFVAGAMTSTWFVERARLLGKARYVAALSVEAVLLATFTVLCARRGHPRPEWLAAALRDGLAFSMGMQNALVTKISGAVVRTTHLTGMFTDLGIELVRLGFRGREKLRGRAPRERLEGLSRLAGDEELDRVRLHLTVLSSFVAGAALQTALYLHEGRVAMALPVTMLALLIAYDRTTVWRREAARTATAAPGTEG